MHSRLRSDDSQTDEEVRTMRLLADRGTHGISVQLYWNETAGPGAEIVVEYMDVREGIAYMIHPPRDRALDAFYHPNAYLNFTSLQAA
jgi:hypothetical protein